MQEQTTYINLAPAFGEAVSPVLFLESRLVISFATRRAAEAAVAETSLAGRSAIRLYDLTDKHGAGQGED